MGRPDRAAEGGHKRDRAATPVAGADPARQGCCRRLEARQGGDLTADTTLDAGVATLRLSGDPDPASAASIWVCRGTLTLNNVLVTSGVRTDTRGTARGRSSGGKREPFRGAAVERIAPKGAG
jgi:hypothetical protein